MVRNIVPEQLLVFGRKGMVGFDLQATQLTAQRDTVRAGLLAFYQVADLAHEGPGIEVDGFVAFLELVQFLDDRDGNHDVVVLKLFDALIVVQDDIGVQHEDFGLAFLSLHLPKYLRGIRVFAEFPPFR